MKEKNDDNNKTIILGFSFIAKTEDDMVVYDVVRVLQRQSFENLLRTVLGSILKHLLIVAVVSKSKYELSFSLTPGGLL